MEGARNHFMALLWLEFIEHHRVAADAQAQLVVLVGVLHCILQHSFVEHVDVDVVRLLSRVVCMVSSFSKDSAYMQYKS
jgi:hypothetical protein